MSGGGAGGVAEVERGLSPILIDDTMYTGGGTFGGKGGKAVPWLVEQGYKIKLAGYQVLLMR